MWVRFTADFDYRAMPRSVIAYRKDQVLNVPTPAGEAAKAAGKAVDAEAPARPAAPLPAKPAPAAQPKPPTPAAADGKGS